ncbi:MAG: tail sheath stabilizer and completion protein [Candidatus Poseidoniales archaeon]
MFEYFYNEILRRTIIGFGTLFNNLTIKATNASDSVVSVTKVPLAYGPTQKFLARLEQQADLNRSTAMTLPRMSFEFTGLTYDPSRKVTTTQTFVVKDPNTGEETKKGFMPVPYNMQFELAIMCKLNDDALQIVEQILPFFQPAYNLTVELVEGIKERRDVPVVLENITMQDDYDGDFKERRVLLYTLRFTAKTYMYGPVSSATRDIIKVAKVSYISGDSRSTTRDISYTVTPRAIKDYTGEVATTIADDITITTKVIEVEDASGLTAKTYIDLNGEELFIKSISGNKITVNRGQDNTTIVSHVKGSPIKVINDADDALIAEGDDFGFSGSIS